MTIILINFCIKIFKYKKLSHQNLYEFKQRFISPSHVGKNRTRRWNVGPKFQRKQATIVNRSQRVP